MSPELDMDHLGVIAAYFGLENLCQLIKEKINVNYEMETERWREGEGRRSTTAETGLTSCLQLLSRCREERESHWLDLPGRWRLRTSDT